MKQILVQMKKEAQAMARELPTPGFYRDYAPEVSMARELFFEHPLMNRLQEDALPFLYDEYGHGIQHAKKVAIDAAALVLVEASDRSPEKLRRLTLLAGICGVLHDSCRLEDDHARRGAELARTVLSGYPLSPGELDLAARSIACHEAFSDWTPPEDGDERILAGCLYDADKFRWGPDNFSTTLWEICDYEDWTLEEVLERFPGGMDITRRVAGTFRTDTGCKYGPELIELGLDMGKTIQARLSELAREAS